MTSTRPGVPQAEGPAAPDEVTQEAREAEEALRRAREVVGLYGDPDVTWGISLEARFDTPVDLEGAPERLRRMAADHPHLGVVPVVERVASEAWATSREQSASHDFSDGRLVRVLASDDGRDVFVTAHHGVCDGLGLLSIVTAATGREVRSSARGVGDRTSSQSFLASSLLRLAEALATPPTRFSGCGDAEPGTPERLVQVRETSGRVNGALLCAALNDVHAEWPRRRTSGGRRFLVVMGASRREPGQSAPDRQTAYFRIPLKRGWSVDDVRSAMRAVEPEPAFPETSAKGVGPMITRALKNRLGYTVNVSNLGVVTGEGLVSMAMFPAVNGPQAVGVGLVTTGAGSTISLRTRRDDFNDDEVQRLLDLVVGRLERLRRSAAQ
ncbi:hypothetical protein IEQ44_00750 [Nocardioides sp. Y6]|uniref:Condensation domain-containing protein n=1 Tax=Nocardioides malaquae TaxID=2773426 RepID=A0ABR9RNN0_9ACTN|nr:hypothetical protein [Nocardioides malaquae]MBE7323179.1 hypothetical protein [Nocardioides malaquae]